MTGRKTGMAALVVAAMVFAGCGSSDKGLSKAEFLKQGNAICTKGNMTIATASKTLGSSQPSPAQAATFAKEKVLPIIDGELKDLGALKAPKSDKATVKAILDAADAGLAKAKADPTLLLGNNNDPNGPFADANKKANAYGLTACGS